MLLAVLVAATALPAAAPASWRHHDRDEAWWDDWRPDPEDESYAEEQELGEDAGDWFDDVEESGDEMPVDEAPAEQPAREQEPSAPSSQRLAGVPYRALIIKYARKRGLEAAFVAAIIRAESGFNPKARSPVGARGLMQLMPATARGMGAKVERLYAPETSIAYGTLYLTHVRAVVGRSTRLIAAGYNAGPGAVKRHGGVPPYAETQAYVRRVASFLAAYRRR